jgi:hypothetical protein
LPNFAPLAILFKFLSFRFLSGVFLRFVARYRGFPRLSTKFQYFCHIALVATFGSLFRLNEPIPPHSESRLGFSHLNLYKQHSLSCSFFPHLRLILPPPFFPQVFTQKHRVFIPNCRVSRSRIRNKTKPLHNTYHFYKNPILFTLVEKILLLWMKINFLLS